MLEVFIRVSLFAAAFAFLIWFWSTAYFLVF